MAAVTIMVSESFANPIRPNGTNMVRAAIVTMLLTMLPLGAVFGKQAGAAQQDDPATIVVLAIVVLAAIVFIRKVFSSPTSTQDNTSGSFTTDRIRYPKTSCPKCHFVGQDLTTCPRCGYRVAEP